MIVKEKCPHCGQKINKKINEKNKTTAIYLIEQGFQKSSIARLLGLSKTTIGRWSKKAVSKCK